MQEEKMMKEAFQTMVESFELSLEEKRRAYTFFSHKIYKMALDAFNEDNKIVYVSGYAFPVELLWAFDVVPFDFEIACNNLPVVMGGQGSTIMAHSENIGYSRDICSFDRLIIACLHQNMLPKGDLFLTSSYYCHGKAKTNEIVANYFDKKSVIFDVPNEISPASIQYVSGQLKEIASRLEMVTGQQLDMDRLKESIRSSNRARSVLVEINELMKSKPCPWNGAEACLVGLAGAIFWGSVHREEINQLFLQDIKTRIEKGNLRPEDHRILWFPWVPVQTTNIFQTLRHNNAGVVMAEAAMVWWPELDEENPFETLALKALQDPHVGSVERRVKNLTECAVDYEVDGAIHFATPACYHENGSLRIIGDGLKEKGIPLLDLAGDMSDERAFSPEQTLNKLSTFIEMLN